ncbi:hypothetical protein BV378_10140 [Nostoc sp. RF31YmG]|nr:hypothetical protein BV378_10140 [Nostoc sp. RF31YmG]
MQRSGYKWDNIPHGLFIYTMVYDYFEKWQRKAI